MLVVEMLTRETTENRETDNGDSASASTWLRLQTASRHPCRSEKRWHGRNGADFIDYVTSMLVDAAAGNLAIGEPSSEDSCPLYMEKPSRQPLSFYAKDAQRLILLGTTLRSLSAFIDGFLRSLAKRGAWLTLLLWRRICLKRIRSCWHRSHPGMGALRKRSTRSLKTTAAKLDAIQRGLSRERVGPEAPRAASLRHDHRRSI